ncbi:MAG TPA: sigma-54 dependent transcriptional regulator [Burkholderiaceae bacterium]|jgi:two-component system response regulator AtoC|nr:sigma-54 dependent transcriptional regulator [Burkholderiaceae bacterium]
MRRILLLENDERLRRELLLGLHGHEVDGDGIADASALGAVWQQGEASVVVVGPGSLSGLGALAREVRGLAAASNARGAAAREPTVVALVPSEGDGMDAIRQGAHDFVLVSAGLEVLVLSLRKQEALRGRAATRAPGPAPTDEGATLAVERFVGTSPKINALLAQVRRFAAVPSAVLVGGESGTGKELVARALHEQSPWRRGPFVPVNCGAIPAGLIESELFGHERGAFTDAVRDKRGLFEVADGGTLFLDEIADLPLALQAKLLRVLQDGTMRRVGATEDAQVRVRIVAASARDLTSEVKAGRFREDLYYRLAGLEIQIPALRERRDDIPRLVAHFLQRSCARLGLSPRLVDPEAMKILVAYDWPGNVRELENTIERAAVLCADDRVDVASLPERLLGAARAAEAQSASEPESVGEVVVPGPELSIKRASREIEESLIRRALARTQGNRVRAAELLEISHRALLYKIKDYGIEVESRRRGAAPKSDA